MDGWLVFFTLLRDLIHDTYNEIVAVKQHVKRKKSQPQIPLDNETENKVNQFGFPKDNIEENFGFDEEHHFPIPSDLLSQLPSSDS